MTSLLKFYVACLVPKSLNQGCSEAVNMRWSPHCRLKMDSCILLILHEEIDYVEFERHAVGTANMHYFDLLVRLKTEQEHFFRSIQRNECHNFFISSVERV